MLQRNLCKPLLSATQQDAQSLFGTTTLTSSSIKECNAFKSPAIVQPLMLVQRSSPKVLGDATYSEFAGATSSNLPAVVQQLFAQIKTAQNKVQQPIRLLGAAFF